MANGGAFNMNAMVAAHPGYPFGTIVRVINLENHRQVCVQILDRGPARSAQADGVIIDVSDGVARKLQFLRKGRTRVRLEVLKWGGRQGQGPGARGQGRALAQTLGHSLESEAWFRSQNR